MLTVAETAILGQRRDICENVINPAHVLDESEFAHTRRVDEDAAIRQLDELASRRRVTPLSVLA